MPDIPLREQIECVRRELVMREFVYARRVADGKMRPDVAALEIARMEAVLDTLQRLEAGAADEPAEASCVELVTVDRRAVGGVSSREGAGAMTEAVRADTPEALRRLVVAWLEDRAAEARKASERAISHEGACYYDGRACALDDAADHWRAVRIEGAANPDREMRLYARVDQVSMLGVSGWRWIACDARGRISADGEPSMPFQTPGGARQDAEASGYEVVT